MKQLLFLSIVVGLLNIQAKALAQEKIHFADYMIIGSSLTYIPTEYMKVKYDELTWNVNLGTNISKRIFTGIQLLNIYASEVATHKKNYKIYGLFTQYNFLKKTDHRFFGEISFNQGNYCTCNYGPDTAQKLFYFGVGFGYDMPVKIVPNLYIDASFNKLFHFK